METKNHLQKKKKKFFFFPPVKLDFEYICESLYII